MIKVIKFALILRLTLYIETINFGTNNQVKLRYILKLLEYEIAQVDYNLEVVLFI